MHRLLAAALVALLLEAASSAGAATRTVRIEKDGFKPTTITVSLDDTVLWRNRDTVRHQVVSDSGAFASPILRAGQSCRSASAPSAVSPTTTVSSPRST